MYIVLIFIITIFLFFIHYSKKYKSYPKLNKCFYNINELKYNFLNNIDNVSHYICDEVEKLSNNKTLSNENIWHDWPEKRLFYKSTEWKIFPFFGFGFKSKKNLQLCPTLSNFLSWIPGIKLAALSKIGPMTKLKKHKGWGKYSNNVIRCHYGINVPDNCFMHVYDDKNNEVVEKIQNKKWTIFDDSKVHYASNNSNKERIVLIIDIERPLFVEKGKSTFDETMELDEFVKKIKDISL